MAGWRKLPLQALCKRRPVSDLCRKATAANQSPIGDGLRRSYVTTTYGRPKITKYRVRPTGFEPVTSGFGGLRSIQLSYGRDRHLQRRMRPAVLFLHLSRGNATTHQPTRGDDAWFVVVNAVVLTYLPGNATDGRRFP